MDDIGARVSQLRTEAGLSLSGLARRSGIARSRLWGIERGEGSPTLAMVSKIAAGLGQPLAVVLNVRDPEQVVVIPVTITPGGLVRCPICHSPFPVADIISGTASGTYVERVGFLHRCLASGVRS